MSDVLFDTEKYNVVLSGPEEKVIGEDGKYREMGGYYVVNKETGVIEHSTIMLPGAIFQATHFNDTLISLLNPVEPEIVDEIDLASLDIGEDVVAN